jgi:hypothetical protein
MPNPLTSEGDAARPAKDVQRNDLVPTGKYQTAAAALQTQLFRHYQFIKYWSRPHSSLLFVQG